MLWWDHATRNNHDVGSAYFFQRFDQFRNQCFMTTGQTGSANNMDIIFCSLHSNFLRRLEKWADVNIETEIGKTGGNYFCTTVMTILSHLGYEDARTPAVKLGKAIG